MRNLACPLLPVLVAVALITAALWYLADPLHRATLWHESGRSDRALRLARSAPCGDPVRRSRVLDRILSDVAGDRDLPWPRRVQAIRQLRVLYPRGPRALPVLLGILRAPDLPAAQRPAVLRALGEIWEGEPELLACLQEQLQDPDLDWSTLRTLSWTLHDMGPAAGELVPAFLQAVSSAPPPDRRGAEMQATSAMWALDHQELRSLPALLQLVEKSKAGWLRRWATACIGGLGPAAREQAAPPLLEALAQAEARGDTGEQVRLIHALRGLGYWRAEHVPPFLAMLVERKLQRAVLFTLRSMGEEAGLAVPDLLEAIEAGRIPGDEDLVTLHAIGTPTEVLAPLVWRRLQSPGPGNELGQAIRILSELDLPAAEKLPSLVELLTFRREQSLTGLPGGSTDLGFHERHEAALALGRLGTEARAAAPALREYIQREPVGLGWDDVITSLARVDPQHTGLLEYCVAALQQPGDLLPDGIVASCYLDRRRDALGALALMGDRVPRSARRVIRSQLLQYDPRVRLAAAHALLAIEGPDPELQAILLEPLRGWREKLQRQALEYIEALGEGGAFAGPALRELVDSPRTSSGVRNQARALLGH